MNNRALEIIHMELARMSAAEAAETLSPHVSESLLNAATLEAGPSLWIVNRSDVYDPTLEALKHHAIPGIADRAREKLAVRHSSLQLLSPPEIEGPIEDTPDYAVEDVLGHPLVPFEAILYFSRALKEDHRASSALSLCRRLVEHPPNWSRDLNLEDLNLKIALQSRFAEMLLGDSSAYVRSYVSRVPILPSSALKEALSIETSAAVQARLLQNPSTDTEVLNKAMAMSRSDVGVAELAKMESRPLALQTLRVLSLDSRLPADFRRQRLAVSSDPLEKAFHEFASSAVSLYSTPNT